MLFASSGMFQSNMRIMVCLGQEGLLSPSASSYDCSEVTDGQVVRADVLAT